MSRRSKAATKIGEKQTGRCEQSRARQRADIKKSFGSRDRIFKYPLADARGSVRAD
jgi:hypothetical protein